MRVKRCKYFIYLAFRLFWTVVSEHDQAPTIRPLTWIVLVMVLRRKRLGFVTGLGGHPKPAINRHLKTGHYTERPRR